MVNPVINHYRHVARIGGYDSRTIAERFQRTGHRQIVFSSKMNYPCLDDRGQLLLSPSGAMRSDRDGSTLGLYQERNQVERLINRLKQYRRIATCYEKYAVNYQAILMIGAIRLWL